ncbi:MAG: ABC transporter ATP-binding protein [Nitrospinota bacterium]|nr:MAG: ABC transporter ATP-binding protein [Nitrospinota bacterium]
MPESAPKPLLTIDNLKTYFFTDTGVAKAVDGVSLVVNPGETLGIVGESGSGKTMTAYSILRIVPRPGRIVAGSIRFRETDLLALREAEMNRFRGRHIAMIFQNPAFSLNPVYTIGHQLGEILQQHEGMSKRAAQERVTHLLKLVGINEPQTRVKQYPHELSGGMKQRVAIARALLCNPALVLADEPTTNLDVTIQAQILDLMQQLKEQFGMSMILITHDMGVVAQMSDRITVMYSGKICESGEAQTIFDHPQHPYTEALLSAMPRVDSPQHARTSRLPVIPGTIPSLLSPPAGCRFHPRCHYATEECQQKEPPLKRVAGDHYVACLYRGE